MNKRKLFFVLCALLCLSFVSGTFAQTANTDNFPEGNVSGTAQLNRRVTPVQIPSVDIRVRRPETGRETAFSVQLLLLLTILTLAPSILILVTCFLRFSIVLDFIKRALSLQQVPPTSVLNGIAFFLTLFVMWPTLTQVYDNSFKPLSDGTIPIERALSAAEAPLPMCLYLLLYCTNLPLLSA